MPSPSATSRRLAAVAACAATILGAAGCGADEEPDRGAPIPAAQASALQKRLGEVERRFRFGDGACADILADSQPAIEQELRALPRRVSADVRTTLEAGFQRLFQLSEQQCDVEKNQPPETTETPTELETTPTTPPETVTVPPPTEPETTPEPTTPPETTPGPGNGQGNGNGFGNGQGNGNNQGNGQGGDDDRQGGGVAPEGDG